MRPITRPPLSCGIHRQYIQVEPTKFSAFSLRRFSSLCVGFSLPVLRFSLSQNWAQNCSKNYDMCFQNCPFVFPFSGRKQQKLLQILQCALTSAAHSKRMALVNLVNLASLVNSNSTISSSTQIQIFLLQKHKYSTAASHPTNLTG